MLWSARKLAILPFAAPLLNTEGALQAILPDIQGAFLGGVWLVHGGAALTPTALANHPYVGLQFAQRRAFLGVDGQGGLMVGASLTPVSVPRLAVAAAALHLKEAVMLDSGYTAALAWANLGPQRALSAASGGRGAAPPAESGAMNVNPAKEFSPARG